MILPLALLYETAVYPAIRRPIRRTRPEVKICPILVSYQFKHRSDGRLSSETIVLHSIITRQRRDYLPTQETE